MGTNINRFKTGTGIPPLDPGTYPATCCIVADLGRQVTVFDGKEKETNQILLTWELPDEQLNYDGEMRPRWISQTFTASVNEKAKLRLWLKNWRGRDFTPQELEDFDLKNVLGAPCVITVTQTEKNGAVYSNIGGISKIMKGMEVKPPTKKVHFSIECEDTWPMFAELPEWVRNKINGSLTLKEMGMVFGDDGTASKTDAPMTAGSGSAMHGQTGAPPMDDMGNDDAINDDDLPF